MTLYIMHLQ